MLPLILLYETRYENEKNQSKTGQLYGWTDHSPRSVGRSFFRRSVGRLFPNTVQNFGTRVIPSQRSTKAYLCGKKASFFKKVLAMLLCSQFFSPAGPWKFELLSTFNLILEHFGFSNYIDLDVLDFDCLQNFAIDLVLIFKAVNFFWKKVSLLCRYAFVDLCAPHASLPGET